MSTRGLESLKANPLSPYTSETVIKKITFSRNLIYFHKVKVELISRLVSFETIFHLRDREKPIRLIEISSPAKDWKNQGTKTQ